MKIMVFLHDLVLGGTTVNAVEMAAALQRNHGHEVVFFGTPGPLAPLVAAHGMRLIEAPVTKYHPSPRRMQALRAAYRQEKPDLVHAWEPWACLDTYVALHGPWGVPMLVTDMQMQVVAGLPKAVPITFGTPALAQQARAAGHRQAHVLLPAVDMDHNRLGAVDATDFKHRHHIQPDDVTMVTVSRLEAALKGESLQRTMAAVHAIGLTHPQLRLRWLLVGDGLARDALQAQAARVNAQLGRDAVTLTGALQDPRVAYSAADIVVGMGSSALRGMAFAKPSLVVGEQGFCALLDPDADPATAHDFEHHGLFGRGQSVWMGDQAMGHANASIHNAALEQALLSLAQRRDAWPSLGDAARSWVQARFGLNTVTGTLHTLCQAAVFSQARGANRWDAAKTAAAYVRHRRFQWRASPPFAMQCADASKPSVTAPHEDNVIPTTLTPSHPTTKGLCPIVMACDEGYAMPLATALRSLVDHNQRHWPIEVHVLHNGFSPPARERVAQSVPQGSLALHWRAVDTTSFEGIALLPHISVMSLARVQIPTLFAATHAHTRMLYLDADILVLDDLAPLCHVDLHGAVMAAVPDWYAKGDMPSAQAAALPPVQQYFNVGVLLWDMQACLRHRVAQRAGDYLISQPSRGLHDQDALNVACDGLWHAMPERWNFQGHHNVRIQRLSATQRPAIAHFITASKPWLAQCSSLNTTLHDRYRNRTMFKRSAWGQCMARLQTAAHRWRNRWVRIVARASVHPTAPGVMVNPKP
jgi:L-malate glycosyltransferase